jgi:hypothetical protein
VHTQVDESPACRHRPLHRNRDRAPGVHGSEGHGRFEIVVIGEYDQRIQSQGPDMPGLEAVGIQQRAAVSTSPCPDQALRRNFSDNAFRPGGAPFAAKRMLRGTIEEIQRLAGVQGVGVQRDASGEAIDRRARRPLEMDTVPLMPPACSSPRKRKCRLHEALMKHFY